MRQLLIAGVCLMAALVFPLGAAAQTAAAPIVRQVFGPETPYEREGTVPGALLAPRGIRGHLAAICAATFPAAPRIKVSGICRMLVSEMAEHVSLYVTPNNNDPENIGRVKVKLPWMATNNGTEQESIQKRKADHLALCASGCGAKRDVKIIKLAHGLDQQHSVHKGMVFLGERLAETRAHLVPGLGPPAHVARVRQEQHRPHDVVAQGVDPLAHGPPGQGAPKLTASHQARQDRQQGEGGGEAGAVPRGL